MVNGLMLWPSLHAGFCQKMGEMALVDTSGSHIRLTVPLIRDHQTIQETILVNYIKCFWWC